MSTFEHIIFMFVLILVSAFFSLSEIALAASRKIRLQVYADEGYSNAKKVLELQENSGNFFTLIQIAVNAVAILGGVVVFMALLSQLRSSRINLNPPQAYAWGYLLPSLRDLAITCLNREAMAASSPTRQRGVC